MRLPMKKTLLCLILIFSISSESKIVESVLAVVEGQMVLESDVKSFSEKFSKKVLVNENLISFLKLKSKNPSKKEVLDYLVSKKIITTFALKDLNLGSEDAVVDRELTNLAKQNRISKKKLKQEITSRGINFNEYKKFIGESSIIRSAIEKNVVSQVRPTEEDFVNFLKQNGISNIQPSYLFDLDQILIPKKLSNSKLLSKSISRDNFKTYFSSSEKFKIESLKLGSLKATDLSKKHAEALKSTPEGGVKVFEEKEAYRIFFVNLKKGNYNIPNSAKIRNLQKKFYDIKIQDQFINWFSEIKSQVFVRING